METQRSQSLEASFVFVGLFLPRRKKKKAAVAEMTAADAASKDARGGGSCDGDGRERDGGQNDSQR